VSKSVGQSINTAGSKRQEQLGLGADTQREKEQHGKQQYVQTLGNSGQAWQGAVGRHGKGLVNFFVSKNFLQAND
jgi:hypothetical protein